MKAVVTADTLTQGQLEAFLVAYKSLEHIPSANGRIVRACAIAGWTDGKPEDVESMIPKHVNVLAEQFDRIYTEATAPDPKA